MRAFKTMIFEELEPALGLLTLNRPKKFNAMNKDMLEDFEELFRMLSRDDSIRVLIITGKGEGFSSGADLEEALKYSDAEYFSDPERFLKLVQEQYASIIIGMRRIPQPVIAAVNGAAAGGGFSLALACDVRVASPEAYFVASFINIGLSGGELGTSYFLPRMIGISRAAEILFTGRKFEADEAERSGLVSRVVSRDKLIDTAVGIARPMLEKSVGGLKLTKRVLDQNIDAPSLEAAINLENRNQSIMVFSKEFFTLIKNFVKGAGE
jgi:enoyl-CoA hydratase